MVCVGEDASAGRHLRTRPTVTALRQRRSLGCRGMQFTVAVTFTPPLRTPAGPRWSRRTTLDASIFTLADTGCALIVREALAASAGAVVSVAPMATTAIRVRSSMIVLRQDRSRNPG